MGIHIDPDNRKKISELVRYKTTKSEDKEISLKEYMDRMQADQKEIYLYHRRKPDVPDQQPSSGEIKGKRIRSAAHDRSGG